MMHRSVKKSTVGYKKKFAIVTPHGCMHLQEATVFLLDKIRVDIDAWQDATNVYSLSTNYSIFEPHNNFIPDKV